MLFLHSVILHLSSLRTISMKTYKTIFTDFVNKVRLDFHSLTLKIKNKLTVIYSKYKLKL